MARYKYLHRLAIVFLIGLTASVLLVMVLFWHRTRQELEYSNQTYCQKVAETFTNAVVEELSRLESHATFICVNSKKVGSAFYQGTANFDTSVYWYYEAVNEMLREYSSHGAADCGIYYYDSGRIITKSSCQTLDSYIRNEAAQNHLDLSDAPGTFFLPENYEPSTMIFGSAGTLDGQPGDMLVGFCSVLGRNADRVLIFYRISPRDNEQLNSLAALNNGVEFCVCDKQTDAVYLRLMDGGETDSGTGELYRADYESLPLVFSVRLFSSSMQNRVAAFYQSLFLLSLASVGILLIITSVSLFIAYRPIHSLARELDLYNGAELDELSAIRNALMTKDFTIHKQRTQIMSLLLDHLIYGGHISHRQLRELGLDISSSPYFCVFFIEGESFLSGESLQLIKATESEFHIRLFMTEDEDAKYSVAIAFLLHDDSEAVRVWIRQWLKEHFITDYTVTAGKIVDKLDDIRASYISCYKKAGRLTDLHVVKKDLQALEKKESRKKEQQDEILMYIEQNYRSADLSQTQVADAFRISTYTLSRLFKNQIGIGFTEYVNTKRIEYAKELLLTTKQTTRDIAEAAGIPNYNYFLRLFKAMTGESPTSFRQKAKRDYAHENNFTSESVHHDL